LTGTLPVRKIGQARETLMSQKLVSPRIVHLLVAAATVLPIAICVVMGVAALLGEMGEPAGRSPLKWVALGIGILWAVDLVCLLLAQGLNSLADSDEDR
jgi:hypothetical protein